MGTRTRGTIVFAFVLATFAAAPATQAANIGCGSKISDTVVLQGDIGPCASGGLVIAARGE